MATIDELKEKQLQNHLIAGGFLGAFTDIEGNPQPAPIIQLLEIDLARSDVTPSKRVVMIRTTGVLSNPSNRIFHEVMNMLVLVVGENGSGDSLIVNGLASDMEKYLVANPGDGECIFNIVSSGVSGPFITSDSRRAYEINVSVSFNIDRPVF